MGETAAIGGMATTMELPVVHVDPGQPLAEVFVQLEGWEQLGDTLRALAAENVEPRVAYAYQLSGSNRLLAKLVLNVVAGGVDEAALSRMLSAVTGLEIVSIQPPTEAGLILSERQRPELVGTPAAIFGHPVIGSLTSGLIDAQGEAGETLLARLGRDAGRQAASALPPLMEQLGIAVSDDLLTRRIRDLQVMGWATVERASIADASAGEVTLVDTFEAAPWNGKASSPTCHFLCGFIGGVFSFVWEDSVACRESECQATGATACRFTFERS